ncbi:LLM class flavin-dependent oxidoreductase [Actinoplanes sp. NPDC049596]|uniref:LLM class flavin-dependent oxidoreductase n=1 Tax=unclassified Actinoplanes TaxID=2626549 RepID=UPI0034169773
MSDRTFPVSVLDLAPVAAGTSPAQALGRSVDLARHAERLGYHRYWVAEHHNMAANASSAPPVLIARIAAVTSTMLVGSGGVILPNHPPLAVAEQFGTLEALYPGRIDLGIGRSPVPPAVAAALRRPGHSDEGAAFGGQLTELLGYFAAPASRDAVIAVPAGADNRPSVWILGSSLASAQLAASSGLPYAFARHLNGHACVPAIQAYRRDFRPSAVLQDPYAMVAVMGVAAETDEEAAWLAGSIGLFALRARDSDFGPLAWPAEAAAYDYSSSEQEFLRGRTAFHMVGGPTTMRRLAHELMDATGADELMISTLVADHAARIRSYEIVADILM